MNKDLILGNSEKIAFTESQQHSEYYINKYLLNEKTKSKIKIFLSFFRRVYLRIFDI